MRLLYVLLVVVLVIDALPQKHSKKKIKKVEKNDEKEDENLTDTDESSADGGSSGEKPKTLERIGFQQVAIANDPAATSAQQVAAPQQSVAAPQIPQAVAQPVSQPQQSVATSNTNGTHNQTFVQPQQSAATSNTNGTRNQPVAQPQQSQQIAATSNKNGTRNQMMNTFQQQQQSSNTTQYSNQTSTYNSNVTNTQANATGSNQQALLESLTGAKSNATEDPLISKRKAELKCFNKFGEKVKGGMTAPDLVNIYEELHECLIGKCNYKKAEVSLQTSLGERTLPGQEAFHKYKCYYNWYELIKKACKPERKQGEEESESEEEVGERSKQNDV